MRRTARHHGDARRLDRHAQAFHICAGAVQILQTGHGALGLQQLCAGRHRLFLVAADGKSKRFQLRFRKVPISLGTAQRAVRVIDPCIGGTTGTARGLIGFGQGRQTRGKTFMRGAGRIGARRRTLHLLFQFFQPVELLQAQGRSRGCVLGPCAIPVPAPQIAVKTDKALTGFQQRLETRAVIGINQADLPHAPR